MNNRTKKHIDICIQIHNNKYDYQCVDPQAKLIDKIQIICPVHGTFFQRLSDHKSGCGCQSCGKDKQTSSKHKSSDHFIELCTRAHGDLYCYDLIPHNVNRHDVVDIVCKKHGKFAQLLNSHINGHGCNECASDTTSKKNTTPISEMIARLIEVHGDVYDYSLLTSDIPISSVVDIICNEHGVFRQRLGSHLKGHGCKLCMSKKTKKTCVERYGVEHKKQVHLSEDTIRKLNDKSWLVSQHHTLKKTLATIAEDLSTNPTTMSRYFNDHNIEVKYFFRSQGELELCQYLDTLNVEYVTNKRDIVGVELDIYIPSLRLAIEYCGLYWHSEQQGKHRNYHKNKMDRCTACDIRLLTVFEDEWKHSTDIVKDKISLLCNKRICNTVYARSCMVGSVTKQDKKSFLDRYHIQGDGPGSMTYGLYDSTNQLTALMTFICKANGTFVLNRYATRCNVPGGFSKLLKRFENTNDWSQILSFADLRWSRGALYTLSGFEHDRTIPTDYSYVVNGKREHKFNFRLKHLPKRLKQFDPQLSERENCDNNGLLRVWDCGKMRFVKYNN